VTHDDRFRLRLGDDGQTICALHAPARPRARVRTAAAEKLAESAIEILRDAGEELALDDLVCAVADRTGLADRALDWEDRFAAIAPADPLTVVESAQTLRLLWSEIALLPPRQ